MSDVGDPRRIPAGATLRDVARASGASISTVSRALREPHLLTGDTLTRVNAAIAALGYRPNLPARNLRGSSTKLTLVVVPSLSPFFLEIVRGAEDAAHALGYGVLIGHTGRRAEREVDLLNEVIAGRADGLIMVTSVDLSGLAVLLAQTASVVALDVSDDTDMPTVRADHEAGAAAATRYLIDQGHRRIAHIAGPLASGMTVHRVAGYRDALAVAGIAADPALLVHGDFGMESGEQAGAALLSLADPPTAIFAGNDQMAIGTIRAAQGMGLHVPRDVSVIGFDDERIAALYDPPLSTVRIPTYDIGHRAMTQLLRLLDDESIETNIVYATELAIRSSTMPPVRRAEP